MVSFSAVSKWNDIPGPPPREESRSNIKHKDRDSKMADTLTAESSSVLDGNYILWNFVNNILYMIKVKCVFLGHIRSIH